MGIAARFAEHLHFVVECLPVAAENIAAADDDVDLVCTGGDAGLNFVNSFSKGREASGESGRDGGDGDRGSGQIANTVLDVLVVDAYRASGDVRNAHSVEEVLANRLLGLGAETVDIAGGVVTAEGGEVDASNCLEEPGGLPFFFDGSSSAKGCRPTFDCAPIDDKAFDAIKIERCALVAWTSMDETLQR